MLIPPWFLQVYNSKTATGKLLNEYLYRLKYVIVILYL